MKSNQLEDGGWTLQIIDLCHNLDATQNLFFSDREIEF